MNNSQLLSIRISRELADEIAETTRYFSQYMIGTNYSAITRDAIEIGLGVLKQRAEEQAAKMQAAPASQG